MRTNFYLWIGHHILLYAYWKINVNSLIIHFLWRFIRCVDNSGAHCLFYSYNWIQSLKQFKLNIFIKDTTDVKLKPYGCKPGALATISHNCPYYIFRYSTRYYIPGQSSDYCWFGLFCDHIMYKITNSPTHSLLKARPWKVILDSAAQIVTIWTHSLFPYILFRISMHRFPPSE